MCAVKLISEEPSDQGVGPIEGETEEVGFEPTEAIHLTRFPVVLTRPL